MNFNFFETTGVIVWIILGFACLNWIIKQNSLLCNKYKRWIRKC